MPAITADTLTLPRVAAAGPADTERPVRSITTGPRGHEGEGFPCRPRVRRGEQRRARPVRAHGPDGRGGVPARRAAGHRLAPAPRLRDGHLHDRRPLRAPGLARWGRPDRRRRDAVDDRRSSGILHIETPPAELVESGGMFHGIQLWVNLPKKDKFATPRYQAIEGHDVALLSSDDGGALIRVIAGEVDGHQRSGRHAHADHVGARDDPARRAAEHPVEPRLQRAGVRAGRARLGRARRRIRCSRASWRCWAPVTASRSTPRSRRIRGPRRWKS